VGAIPRGRRGLARQSGSAHRREEEPGNPTQPGIERRLTAEIQGRWDTVCVVSMLEIHLYVLGIPLLLVLVLVALIWSRKGPHPATYKLSEPWTHPPILWAATDEDVGGGHHGDGTAGFSVGGGASGKW
jgi:hypothetical protein